MVPSGFKVYVHRRFRVVLWKVYIKLETAIGVWSISWAGNKNLTNIYTAFLILTVIRVEYLFTMSLLYLGGVGWEGGLHILIQKIKEFFSTI